MNKQEDIPDYRFNMNLYMGHGWDLFKKGAGSFIGYTIVQLVVIFMFQNIPYLSYLGNIVQAALTAGIFIFSYYLVKNREEFGQFFQGFQYFFQILLYQLVLLLIFLPFLLLLFGGLFSFSDVEFIFGGPAEILEIIDELDYRFETDSTTAIMLTFIFFAATIYIYNSYSLVLPLIVVSNMGFWEAMETSRRTVQKNFFAFIGLYFVLILIALVITVVTCGLGLVALIPYFNLVIYSAYEDIFRPDDNSLSGDIETFGTGYEDINTETGDR